VLKKQTKFPGMKVREERIGGEKHVDREKLSHCLVSEEIAPVCEIGEVLRYT
jgi:hypothetical protein